MANIVTVLGDLVVNGLTTIAGLLSRTNGTASFSIDLQIASTTDATATTIATYPVPASGSVGVLTYIKGPQSDGSNGFQQLAVNSARRSGAGAPTLSQGAGGIIVAALENTYAVTRPSVQYVISGNNLLVQVVGKVATNIQWAALLINLTR